MLDECIALFVIPIGCSVQGNTAFAPGYADAGVFQVPDEDFGLAVTVDCNARWVALDPYQGGMAVVAEAARNLACVGAQPLGITDCLNFGNPEKPEVFFQFREACRGIADACRAFDTPVTGGNVSFYNESPTGAVDPTPTVGMVGLLRNITRRAPAGFAHPGDLIVIAGRTSGHLGGSSYWAEVLGCVGGAPPPVHLEQERQLQRFLIAANQAGLLASAHDVSEGGLAVALAESCIGGPYAGECFGARLDLRGYADSIGATALFFGEDHGRAVISLPFAERGRLARLAAKHEVPIFGAGRVSGPGEPLEMQLEERAFAWDLALLRRTYMDAIPRRMAAVATSGGEGA